MFKKSSTNKQFDLFNSPSDLMCGRESRVYDNPSAWHNKFYREVTSNIDEEIFRPLFAEDREDKKDGRPNAPIRILIAMSILKEGSGCSDESLFENCCFNMLYRRALGMVTLNEQCPSIDSYYMLRRRMAKYEEETGIALFDKCFKGITRKQALEYRISGKSVRMDSKLISSNIAWYTRYEIIHETLCKSVEKCDVEGATTADNTYVESGVKGSEEVTTTRRGIGDSLSTRCRRWLAVHGSMCADFCCLTSKWLSREPEMHQRPHQTSNEVYI